MKQETIKIIVLTSREERQKYFNLFKFLVRDRIAKIQEYSGKKAIITDKEEILFMGANEGIRGHKCHYMLNLTQNLEFHQSRAVGCVFPLYSMLKDDEDWAELFDKIK